MSAKGVLCDLDGVLVDSTVAVEGHWRAFAVRHDLDEEVLLADLHGRRMVDIMAAALPDLPPAQLADEGARLEQAEADGARDGTLAQPGARQLTASLEGRRWAIVTSGTVPVATARIQAVGLVSPPVLVTGEEVASGKPDPAPYLLAAERLGIPPEDCVVIEDAPAGLAAGRAAGCATIAVTTSHVAEELMGADHLVRNPADLGLVADDHRVVLSVRCSLHG
ncbi:MAG: HAD family hydrolase [Nitriliruptor sp.]|nr:MAG: HAD family hydrolase [Nitriliruptor sp.]